MYSYQQHQRPSVPQDFVQATTGSASPQMWPVVDPAELELCHSMGWLVQHMGGWPWPGLGVQLTLPLHPMSDEFKSVDAKFQETCQGKDLKVVYVWRVQNPTLYRKFLANKNMYNRTYGKCRVIQLFHGTKMLLVPSILKDNLDTRYIGALGSRYGKGVNFSAISYYASHACDNHVDDKYMLLCDVLLANMVEVPEGSAPEQPPLLPGNEVLRYDTTTKSLEKLDVVVKYERDVFYPTYVLHLKRNKKFDWFRFYGGMP